VHDAKRPSLKSLYASATRVDSSGDVILKVVNTASGAIESEVRLDGVTAIDGAVRAVVLTAPSPTVENTLEQPTKVAPVPTTVEVKGHVLRHSFPGNSLTVIRVRPAAR
jgi:alpha-L-arabinofuranosidase